MLVAVIPARYASTRFPGKPLVEIQGKSMIQRVYEQCCKSKFLQKVVVATDDARIYDHVLAFGGEVLMTNSEHVSGTDRVGEVANLVENATHILNVQGDEPFIDPKAIDELAQILQQPHIEIATLIRPISEAHLLQNSNVVKVVIDNAARALYFSRNAIPFVRNEKETEKWLNQTPFYQHVGMYGFKSETLKKLVKLPVGKLEQAESLEQLRWIEAGYSIYTAITHTHSKGIDTPDDLIGLV